MTRCLENNESQNNRVHSVISCWNKPVHLGRLRIEDSIATGGSVAILRIRQVDVARCETPIYPREAGEAIQLASLVANLVRCGSRSSTLSPGLAFGCYGRTRAGSP